MTFRLRLLLPLLLTHAVYSQSKWQHQYEKAKEIRERLEENVPFSKVTSLHSKPHSFSSHLQEMKQKIRQVKNSIPPQIPKQDQQCKIQDDNTTQAKTTARRSHPSLHQARYEKIKQGVANSHTLDRKPEHNEVADDYDEAAGNEKKDTNESENKHSNDDLLKLTLTKPLGFLLDGDNEEEAVVFALDDQLMDGSAHKLPVEIIKDLLERRIVSVNQENVADWNLEEIANLIVSTPSPIDFEFAKHNDNENHYDDTDNHCDDDEDEEEEQDILTLTLSKPFGFYLDADTEDEAIVFAINHDQPEGSVHKLPQNVQQNLLERRIVSINSNDVSEWSLEDIADLIIATPSPIEFDFERVNKEDYEDEDEEDQDEDDEEDDDDDDGPSIDFYQEHEPIKTLEPGQLSLLKWKDTKEVIDPYAGVVGLPKTLLPAILAYAERLQIFKGLKKLLYEHPCEPDDGRFYETENPHVAPDDDLEFLKKTHLVWYAQRPGMHWSSDMHWFAGSDERTHESMLQMLFQGGFQPVLEAIGTHYNMDGLFVQSVGFLGVTHCEEGYLHWDFKDNDGKFFNFLIPVWSPETTEPELNVAGKRLQANNETATVGTKVKYSPDYGVLVGDNTLHGTREVDHRPDGEMRIMLSIYLADVTEGNIDEVSYDDTAIFPVPERHEWLWTQRGRHWQKDQCMIAKDFGRRPIQYQDASEQCAEVSKLGKCESNPKLARQHCPRSCEVYMDDWEYRPGVERLAVMGEFDFDLVQ